MKLKHGYACVFLKIILTSLLVTWEK